ncbi:MAG: hypothetical protein ACE5DI_00225 [Candidatus Micrarchaeia archaeon]
MSRISEKNFQKIAEQALFALFQRFPQPRSTRQIATEICRDNEFTSKIMVFLHGKKLVLKLQTSKSGGQYTTKQVWKLSKEVYQKYSKMS